MSIGNRIREKRKSKDMTLEELSKFAGVSRQTLSRYENDIIAVPSDRIEKIAAALDTTPQFLMGWEDPLIDDFDNTLDEVVSALENADCIVLYTDSWRDNTVVVKDKKGGILLSCQDNDLVSRAKYLRKKHLPLTAKNILDLTEPEEETIHTIAAHAIGELTDEDIEEIIRLAKHLKSKYKD